MRVAAVILAAGASSRLGQAKQLVRLNGETLLDRAVRCAHEAECWPVVVVLGARAGEVSAGSTLESVRSVVNPEWEQGMATSIRAGLDALPEELVGALLMTCDQPAVTPGHLLSLLSLLTPGKDPVASRYAGRNGIPAYFPAGWFGRLRELQGDRGARDLLQAARAIEFEGGEIDIDTPEALERGRKLFEL